MHVFWIPQASIAMTVFPVPCLILCSAQHPEYITYVSSFCSPRRGFHLCWIGNMPVWHSINSIGNFIIEGSLEVKLPTIWTDENQRWEESERKY